MRVPKKETFEQIFDKYYDNTNKICTRRSLLEQFKTVAKEWVQQYQNDLPEGLSSEYEIMACSIYKRLVEDLEK